MQLNDIGIREKMLWTNLLPVEDTATPGARIFEGSRYIFVHKASHVENRGARSNRKRAFHLRRLSGCLRVNADDLQTFEEQRADALKILSRGNGGG